MTGTELDNVFNDSYATEVYTDTNTSYEAEVEQEEKGENEVDTETTEKEETPSSKDSKTIPFEAYDAERKKRQALEAELNEFKNKNPDSEVEVDEELDIDEKLFNERVIMSREILSSTKDDYEEKVNRFIKELENSPALYEQYRASQNPAKFAYEKGRELFDYEEFKSNKDSEDYKEFLIWKKDKKNNPKPNPEEVKKAQALSMPKLNNATSKTGASKVQEELITKLEDCFK